MNIISLDIPFHKLDSVSHKSTIAGLSEGSCINPSMVPHQVMLKFWIKGYPALKRFALSWRDLSLRRCSSWTEWGGLRDKNIYNRTSHIMALILHSNERDRVGVQGGRGGRSREKFITLYTPVPSHKIPCSLSSIYNFLSYLSLSFSLWNMV